jgi:hypothetical protein
VKIRLTILLIALPLVAAEPAGYKYWSASDGTGTLVVGGTIPGGKSIAPGEIRGPAVEGGTRQKLSAGDIVHIPSKTPHNVLVDPGAQITYFIFKVKE